MTPPKVDVKVVPPEAGLDVLVIAQAAARLDFVVLGQVRPRYVIEAMWNSRTGVPEHRFVSLATRFEGADDEIGTIKEWFAHGAERMAMELRACAIVFLAEMWMVVGATRDEIGIGDVEVALSTHPARREAVWVMHERAGLLPACSVAWIEDMRGTRTLGAFEDLDMHVEGRFAHRLRQPPRGTS